VRGHTAHRFRGKLQRMVQAAPKEGANLLRSRAGFPAPGGAASGALAGKRPKKIKGQSAEDWDVSEAGVRR
jgi:hypothetical protein